MDHQSNSISLFTKHSSLVTVESTSRGPEFFANSKEGCTNTECHECIFEPAESCYISTSDKAYNSIFTYFQAHHSEKLI